ncbi:MAG: restriction endonuclease subunit S [Pseudomonas sp.]
MNGFKPYPAYKDSGVEWLGDVPVGWVKGSLKHMAWIRNGKDHKEAESPDGAYPVIGSGGQFSKASRYLYDGESVLLGRKGTIDKPLYITGRFWTVDTMFYTEVSKAASARFLYYYALTIPFGFYSTSTALPSMTQGDLLNHPAAIPSLFEQTQIARFLDHETARIDTLIAEQQRLIELLKEKRQAVISHAVTKGLDPSVPMKDSGVEWLGEVPAHWDVKKLKHFGRVVGGFAFKSTDFSSDGHPVLKISNVGHLCFEWGDQSYLPDEFRESHSEFIAPKGALVFAMTRPVIAGGIKVARLEDDSLPLVNQRVGFMVIHYLDLSRYVLLSTQSDPFLSQFKNNLTITNQPNISSEGIESISIAVPPLIEMKDILAFCLKVDAEVQSLIGDALRGTELLQERRSALISAAVTGKIDVRGWQPPASTQALEEVEVD